MNVHQFGIDVETRHAKVLVERLIRLPSTKAVRDAGPYWHCRAFSQVHIDTTMTEQELDSWLFHWNQRAIDVVGVFSRAGEPMTTADTQG